MEIDQPLDDALRSSYDVTFLEFHLICVFYIFFFVKHSIFNKTRINNF